MPSNKEIILELKRRACPKNNLRPTVAALIKLSGNKTSGVKYQIGFTAFVALRNANRVPISVYKAANKIRARGRTEESPSRRSIVRLTPFRIARIGKISAPRGK